VQKRRRSKAVPKDIFGNAPKPITPKKEVVKQPSISNQTPVHTPATPHVIEHDEDSAVVEESPVSTEEVTPSSEEDVIQSQILGTTRRKSIGLQPKQEEPLEDLPTNVVSVKAQELIDESKLRAKNEQRPIQSATKVVKNSTIQKTPETKPKPPVRKPRRRRNSFQPAARAKRLDRSRHMEYKYEVRGLLVDIGVEDEHRSNVLGTMWAKGERQNAAEAKEFLEGKHSEGILTEVQLKRLCDVIDRYTVRR
ncbi:uncharacterized protein METZ01_LOCUS326112, partial [marine metagenome]